MIDILSFAQRIRAHFSDNLTGIIVVGGTRTKYILDHRHEQADPGAIPDLTAYTMETLQGYLDVVSAFFELGGQNLIAPILSHQGFYDRGSEFGDLLAQFSHMMVDAERTAYYRALDVDPYFVGIDTLLALPKESAQYTLGVAYAEFQRRWEYRPGRRKLLWEVAPIPLYSLAHQRELASPEALADFDNRLSQAADMREMQRLTYAFYANLLYGTDVPEPHFYLATGRNGDLKLRAMTPIALMCGPATRFYYTPYPSIALTREALATVIEDVAFGERFRTDELDYRGKYSPELLEAEYQRLQALVADPSSIIGLTRKVTETTRSV